jgi:tRNA G18 (ribose-2'-O)-methylase SpoU
MRDIILVIHDIRSCHNVGSLLRTAEGLGVAQVYLTGYTPYPTTDNDTRLPHIHQKLTQQIHKTALGAEVSQPWQHVDNVFEVLDQLSLSGYKLVALEQSNDSVPLNSYKGGDKTALILGREVEGIDADVLARADATVEIPMYGDKESFNVVQAAAMALYQLRFN